MWELTPKLKEWFLQIPDTISEVSVQKSGGLEKRYLTEPENLKRTWGWRSHTSHTGVVSPLTVVVWVFLLTVTKWWYIQLFELCYFRGFPYNIRGNLLWFGAIWIWIERKRANTCMWLDRCCVTMLSVACEICFCLTSWLWVINPRKSVLVRNIQTSLSYFSLANNSKILFPP